MNMMMNQINNFNQCNPMNFNNLIPNQLQNMNMNNIQSNYCMNNSFNGMNMGINQNYMNNMINSNNMNNYNNFNYMNNCYNDDICNNMNNLANSYNNISLSMNSDDFSLGETINDASRNTCKPIVNEINITFAFTTTETFDISAKIYDKLSTIIDKFQENQCPEKLKNNWSCCLHNGLRINIEKTLKELGIKNGDKIIFLVKDIDYNNMNIKENNNSNSNTLAQLSSSGIIIKEHIHNLVYCLNNFSWKCNLCKGKYEKISPKYYCSICNFSVCEKCHDIRNYPKKKAFPDEINDSNISIKKKFLKTAYHKHYLVYSRTSRDSDELKQWYCNNCQDVFENNIWSFYCTKCDYDLCKKCAGYN